VKRTRPSRGEESWPERAPPTWWEAAAVTARTAGFMSTRSSSSMGNPSERDEHLRLCLPSAKRDGEPKLLCTTSFVTHVLLII